LKDAEHKVELAARPIKTHALHLAVLSTAEL